MRAITKSHSMNAAWLLSVPVVMIQSGCADIATQPAADQPAAVEVGYHATWRSLVSHESPIKWLKVAGRRYAGLVGGYVEIPQLNAVLFTTRKVYGSEETLHIVSYEGRLDWSMPAEGFSIGIDVLSKAKTERVKWPIVVISTEMSAGPHQRPIRDEFTINLVAKTCRVTPGPR